MAPIALQCSPNGSLDHGCSVGSDVTINGGRHVKSENMDPIAVVGYAFKFPQEATNPDAFWQMLKDKRCAMTEWPKDRLNVDAFYHSDSQRPDTIAFRGGHFLEEPLGNFDAPFFSITSVEAAAIDPQQRLLLETAYKALENAGIPLEKVSGSNTSVHTGCFSDDYKQAISRDPSTLPTYAATGIAASMLANRISWFFNLTGPSVNLDSACSSSMMAFELACQGLRLGDSNMAMVGGANIAFALDTSLPLSNMNFLSQDSRCFSFDDRANGYGRGEGFGVVLLKRLTDALLDGDTIRAVVRATGSNQDGHTPGITQPSAKSQLRLIKETYDKAGLDMEPTRYVEAHGTGTTIGDPVEAHAIGTAFRDFRSSEQPIYIGAVKSNIGHLEGASGIAGIIKTIMILEAGIIPPNANFEKLNPSIDAESLKIMFPQQMVPWPSRGLRRASVMSFGFGGSNSHVIMDDAYNFLRLKDLMGNHWSVQDPPSLEDMEAFSTNARLPSLMQRLLLNSGTPCTSPRLLVWSAADEEGLKRLRKDYSHHLSQVASYLSAKEAVAYLDNLSYTLATRRTSFSWKSFVVARSVTEFADRELDMSKAVRTKPKPTLGYVFTGQGAQYAGMAKDLVIYPAFHNSLRRSEIYFGGLGCQWSLQDELFRDKATSNISHPAYSQPICTAVQIALVDLLRTFGIVPTAVVGHSSGEIAAAYSAGYLSHQSACKVSYFRGQCAAKLLASDRYQGAMMAVGLPEASLEPYLKGLTDVVIGCVNSPRSSTVSGNSAQIDSLKVTLDRDSVFSRKLHVDIAYHSPQMSDIAAEYLMLLGDIEQVDHHDRNPVMISTVTGTRTSLVDVQKATYWVDNLVSQVKFSAALEQICSPTQNRSGKKLRPNRTATEVTDLLEIGPHSALQGPIKDGLSKFSGNIISYASILMRSISAEETLLNAIGRLYCLGYPVDICEVNQLGDKSEERHAVLPNLPEYPFDHSRVYWSESRLSKEGYRLRQYPYLDLLGSPAPDWNPLQPRWRRRIRAAEMPWIEDHKVNGTVVYPAAGMLVMALEAAKLMDNGSQAIVGYKINDAIFSNPLVIANDPQGTETELYLRPLGESSRKDSASEFNIYVNNGDQQWTETCRGIVQIDYKAQETEVDVSKEAKARQARYRRNYEEGLRKCSKTVDESRMYKYMQDIGLEYGPAFQGLQQLSSSNDGAASGKVSDQWSAQHTAHRMQPHIIHPTTLDTIFQLVVVALSKGADDEIPTMMPTRVGKFWIKGQGVNDSDTSILNAHARAVFSGRRKACGGVFAMDETTNNILVTIEDAELTTVAAREASTQSQEPQKRLCYKFAWRPDLDLLSHRQIQEYCEGTRPHRVASDVEFYENLGFILMNFMSDALSSLKEEDISSTEPYLRKYIEWSKFQLDRFHAGSLPGLSSSHSRWNTLVEDAEYRENLICQVESAKQGQFFIKVGRNLITMLKGQMDPLSFLFQGDMVSEFYRAINSNVTCYETLNLYLDAISHKNPALKVLEIGAGTGATTDSILKALSNHKEGNARTLNCTQYDFTDLSPVFFEPAAIRYVQNQEKLRFKILDIEADPAKQGFELGTYDLVFAASVLHATKNLEVTMRNVRALLKPGGKVVIFEVTEDVIRARFAFGLLPGWWLSEEPSRQWGPCISINEWDDLLRKSGFSGVDLEIPDYADERCHEYTIMISTATEPPQNLKTDNALDLLHFRNATIIVDSLSHMQQGIAKELRHYFVSDRKVSCRILSLEQASSSANLEDTFCLSLVEMDTPLLSNLDERSLKTIQQVLLKAAGILWVTGGGSKVDAEPQLHLIEGLARVARTELDKHIFVTLALENRALVSERQASNQAHHIRQVLEQTLSQHAGDVESEFVEKEGRLEIGRVVEASNLNDDVFTKTKCHGSSRC